MVKPFSGPRWKNTMRLSLGHPQTQTRRHAPHSHCTHCRRGSAFTRSPGLGQGGWRGGPLPLKTTASHPLAEWPPPFWWWRGQCCPVLLANERLTGAIWPCGSSHTTAAEQPSIFSYVLSLKYCSPRRAVGLSDLKAVNKVGAVGGGTCKWGAGQGQPASQPSALCTPLLGAQSL